MTTRSILNFIAYVTLLAALSCAGCADTPKQGAEAKAPTQALSSQSTATAAGTSAPKCYQGCERWGESCNVDPRGVYKCARRCEKFGEICE